MTINQVSLRLQSQILSTEDLAHLVGSEPHGAVERGSPVSSRRPSGPLHSATTIVYLASAGGQDFGPYLAALRPLLDRLADRAVLGEFAADLVIAVTGAPMGFMASLDPATIRLLGAAGCGIIFDVYEFGSADT